ncbi:hemolysin family protein [Corynebacterium aquilae]|uniref:Membrane protein n=1 Tax=Corynebacterium aquilae DSM 44791 TaxID=1431546 RepID=A0A1L7CFU7_9CORY|nr:hemolysin family protein [Corynebacterium aquilae]APT84717.1 membrane protein [Corynebacterium aquilae DSM 44791]
MGGFEAIVLTILLLGVNAFFVGAEFALISSRRDRLDALIAQGKTRARTVLEATEHLSMMLAGAQFGITIASLLLGKVGEPAIAHLIEGPAHAVGLPDTLLHPVAFALALGIVTFLHIIAGEMVPKNIALAGPESVAMLLVPTHVIFVRFTRPIIVAMNWMAGVTLKMFGIEQKDELDSTVNPKQLASMITESRSEGLLDAEEHARLKKALRQENRQVKEVLVPLAQVRNVEFGTKGPTLAAIEHAVEETGYSRFPVTGGSGSFIGYVHIKDILDRLVAPGDSSDQIISRSEIRTLTTIDGDASLDEAMRDMRRRSVHIAQVRSAGTLLGIVTLEDLIEEYVGTVRDWTHEDDDQSPARA